MSTVREILAQKGSAEVHCIGPAASIVEAAQRMNAHKIGALVVVEEGQILGMFTERDVLQRIVASRRDPASVTVGEVMTQPVACCGLDTEIGEARSVFKNRRIRHLPIVDDNRRVLGLISIGDLNAHEANAKETTIHLMREYIYGRT